MKNTQPCVVCGKPSLTGLAKGHGLCKFHWNMAHWGREWAEKCAEDDKKFEDAMRLARELGV
jgi:hypothetical protein